jgi:hypothetical protein
MARLIAAWNTPGDARKAACVLFRSLARRLLTELGLAAACAAVCAGGCAAEVNTLEDAPPAGDGGVAPLGGKPSSAGTTSSSGTTSMAGAAGSKVVNAFGGTATGGTTTGGTAGVGGAAGTAGAGGIAHAGSSGGGGINAAGTGGGGTASQGGAGGKTSGGTGGTGSSLACLMSWKNDACDTCSKQTQGDKLGCVDILDCYAANSCGPATCGGNTEKCGANNIAKGTAGYPIAQEVYTCLCK